MKNCFSIPELELIELTKSDIITTSNDGEIDWG